MKFNGESYSFYAKDIHQIWCRSTKFLWKSKFYSGSWYYFGFQHQTYIWYIEDTHQILFGSANSFESYCVHMKSPCTYSQTTRQPDKQTDRRNFFCLFCLLRHTKHKHSSKGEIFFYSCGYNTFSFYILRMWWESKKIVTNFLFVHFCTRTCTIYSFFFKQTFHPLEFTEIDATSLRKQI